VDVEHGLVTDTDTDADDAVSANAEVSAGVSKTPPPQTDLCHRRRC
jgi:hypothetical protein